MSKIDLSNVVTWFIKEENISKFFMKRMKKIESWPKPTTENQMIRSFLEENKNSALKNCANYANHFNENLKNIRRKIPEILKEVAQNLGEYLPDWTAPKTVIRFLIYDKKNSSAFIRGNQIFVNLLSNGNEKLLIESITHELVHRWMQPVYKKQPKNLRLWLALSNYILPICKFRIDHEEDFPFKVILDPLLLLIMENRSERIRQANSWEKICRTIDEGLAQMLSGNKEKDDTSICIGEAFFESLFLPSDVREVMREDIETDGFRGLACLYDYGLHLAETVKEEIGMKKFRKLTIACRENPMAMVEAYNRIKNWKEIVSALVTDISGFDPEEEYFGYEEAE
jgi:hypothetical protein